MRKAAGDDVDFVLGGGNRLTPGDASALAADLERFHLLWFDEPCPVTNLSAIAKIANERVVPLGFGASVLQPAVFQDLLRDGLIDVVRPDISVYGILQSRRIAAMAETYYTAVAPHHEGGPVATVAAMHLAASLPNFYIQHIPPCAAADRAMRQELLTGYAESVSDGFAALPGGPGLGIQINEQALEKFRERAA
jgi:galactonate dehydratase